MRHCGNWFNAFEGLPCLDLVENVTLSSLFTEYSSLYLPESMFGAGYIGVSLSVRLSVCLSVCLSICL